MMEDMILQGIAPAPGTDLVGSIIGVEEPHKFPRQRSSAPKDAQPAKENAKPDEEQVPLRVVWRNVLIFIYLHAAALYGFYLCFTATKWATLAWALWLHLYGGFGITGGAHRHWAHRAFKAKLPMRLFMAIGQTIAVQNDIYEWCRDHRAHHKFSETDADPHNANRGFFFAHVGWLLCRKHPEVRRRGKTIDCSDLLKDPVVYYQRKYYIPLVLLAAFVVPSVIPWYFWGESFRVAFFVASMFRYCFTLNVTWLVNSAAHIWGNHPYDKNINPAENKTVAFLTSGEGWHNYHHTFPWDYKAAELGNYSMNMTKFMIDVFAKFGQAYDLKTVSDEMINRRVRRTGDGSHPHSNVEAEDHSHDTEDSDQLTHLVEEGY